MPCCALLCYYVLCCVGQRQPQFANSGAVIVVSREAMQKVRFILMYYVIFKVFYYNPPIHPLALRFLTEACSDAKSKLHCNVLYVCCM